MWEEKQEKCGGRFNVFSSDAEEIKSQIQALVWQSKGRQKKYYNTQAF